MIDNKMRRDSDTDLLDEQPKDDPNDRLRADVMGSIAGSDPNSPSYLGRINHLVTAHGAIGEPAARMSSPTMTAPTPTAMPPEGRAAMAEPQRMGEPKQRGWLGRIGSVASRMGNIAGDIFAPGVMANIPGTDMNKRLEAQRAERTKGKQQQLVAEQENADANKSRADTEARKETFAETKGPQAKTENVQQGYADAIRDALANDRDPNTDPHVQAWKKALQDEQKPPETKTPFEAWQKQNPNAPASDWLALEAKNKSEKTPSETEQAVSDYLQGHGMADTPANRDKARDTLKTRDRTPRQPTEREEWMKDHPGASMEDYWKAKASAPAAVKEEATEKSKAKVSDDALNYAKDYLENKHFTGAGDEALQEKFFELAKPSTGFRMSQPQMDMLRNSRSWMDSVEGHIRHATVGTWFSDQQRKEIVDTMNQIVSSKGKGNSNSSPNVGGITIERDANGRIVGVH